MQPRILALLKVIEQEMKTLSETYSSEPGSANYKASQTAYRLAELLGTGNSSFDDERVRTIYQKAKALLPGVTDPQIKNAYKKLDSIETKLGLSSVSTEANYIPEATRQAEIDQSAKKLKEQQQQKKDKKDKKDEYHSTILNQLRSTYETINTYIKKNVKSPAASEGPKAEALISLDKTMMQLGQALASGTKDETIINLIDRLEKEVENVKEKSQAKHNPTNPTDIKGVLRKIGSFARPEHSRTDLAMDSLLEQVKALKEQSQGLISTPPSYKA